MKIKTQDNGPLLPGWKPSGKPRQAADAAAQSAVETVDERVRPYLPVDIVAEIRRCFPGEDEGEVSIKLLRYALRSGGAFHPSFQDMHAVQQAIANSLDELGLCTMELNRQLNNLAGASELKAMLTAMPAAKPTTNKVVAS